MHCSAGGRSVISTCSWDEPNVQLARCTQQWCYSNTAQNIRQKNQAQKIHLTQLTRMGFCRSRFWRPDTRKGRMTLLSSAVPSGL